MPTLLAQAAEAGSADTAEVILFWVFAVMAVGAGLAVILMKNVVHAALMLVLNLMAIAALFLALQSSFLGIVQIIVYAGAIMVLFLFVIMLLGVTRDDQLFEPRRRYRAAAGVGGAVLVGLVLFAFAGDFTGAASRCGAQAGAATDAVACEGLDTVLEETEQGAVGVVARRMFTRYTFPFEAAALLLVVATIGALVLGRRHDPAPAEDLGAVPEGPEPPGAPSDTDVVLADDATGPEVV